MKRLLVGLLTAAVVSGGMAACSTEPEPPPSQPVLSLVGTWDCIEFTDGGVPLGCSGTIVFGADGSVSIQITIGGIPPISETGTYVQTGTTVVIDAGGDVTTFIIATAGAADVITLTDATPPPATPVFITLRRQ